MASVATVQLNIVKFGGPITKDVYKSYYSNGTAANENWKKGEIVRLVSGVIRRCGALGTASVQNSASSGTFENPGKLFVALEDHVASDFGKSVYVAVQEIMPDTVIEFAMASSDSTVAAIATYVPGAAYGLYMSTAGIFGLDVHVTAGDGTFVVVDKDTELYPHRPDRQLFIRTRAKKSILL
jgi:hypothetical protein